MAVNMLRLSGAMALAAVLALTLGACIPGDVGCCGSLDRLSPVGAVIDARVVRDGEGSSVVLEVEMLRTAPSAGRLREGEEIVAAHHFSEYELDSDKLTFFLVSGGPLGGEWAVAYVHDRTVDAPVAGFPNQASPYGASVAEMFECLVEEHQIAEGEDLILRALMAEIQEPKLESVCSRPASLSP